MQNYTDLDITLHVSAMQCLCLVHEKFQHAITLISFPEKLLNLTSLHWFPNPRFQQTPLFFKDTRSTTFEQ